MKTKGRDILLYVEEKGILKRVALSTNCGLTVQCDMAEFTSALSGRGKRVRPGRYSWQINVDTLIDDSGSNVKPLLNYLITGIRFLVTMQIDLGDEAKMPIRGYCYVQTWDTKAPVQGMAACSAVLIGDGNLMLL